MTHRAGRGCSPPVSTRSALALGLIGLLSSTTLDAIAQARPQPARAALPGEFEDEDEPVSVLFAPPREDAPPPQLEWVWRRFQTEEYVLTGAAMAATVGLNLATPPAGRWRGAIGFDTGVRRRVGLDNYRSRRNARDASDLLLAATVTFPILVDGLLSASWYHDSPDVAEQLILIDLEVFSVTLAVQSLVTTLSGRERPYGDDCGGELDEEVRECRRDSRHRSFFSGHASASFAGASLVCIHRAYLPLSGGGVADALTCGTAYAAASATAVLRVAGEMHYASDVLVGAAWGTLAGLGLPWLLHYRHGPERAPRSVYLMPQLGGMAVGGHF